MSGQKGMKQFGKEIIEEVKRQRESGKTYKEIAEYFNLRNSESVRELLKRDKRSQQSWKREYCHVEEAGHQRVAC